MYADFVEVLEEVKERLCLRYNPTNAEIIKGKALLRCTMIYSVRDEVDDLRLKYSCE